MGPRKFAVHPRKFPWQSISSVIQKEKNMKNLFISRIIILKKIKWLIFRAYLYVLCIVCQLLVKHTSIFCPIRQPPPPPPPPPLPLRQDKEVSEQHLGQEKVGVPPVHADVGVVRKVRNVKNNTPVIPSTITQWKSPCGLTSYGRAN